ncbi:hypothetical protein HZA87_01975 [Candidatus Uhrbacteria bacterium]|nr:hypothetical protein [Candidatus Uhrbacteria bacterium]
MFTHYHPLKGVLLLFTSMLVLILWVRACDTTEKSANKIDPFASPLPVIAVAIDGHTAFVPPGPPRLRDVPVHLQDAIRMGVARVTAARLDKEQCVPSHILQLGWRRCLGDYLVAAVDEDNSLEVIEVYGGKPSRPGFTVACEREGACDGGVNPPFIISTPPGWTVVAIRTAVLDKDGTDGIGAAVYIPYSTRLNDQELRTAGVEYLRDAVLAAFYELRAKDVRSQFIPGKYVTDFGTPDHVIALILTEQMYSDKWFADGGDVERLEMLDRALVTLGLNRWRSYQYTASWAGARGIGQIVGDPYKAIRSQYPRAELPADSIKGRTDHHTSIKAMIAHTDAELWTFKGDEEAGHRAFLLGNDWERQLVFAAGYNANVATVHHVIHECKQRWRENGCGATCATDAKTCVELPEETRLYLTKYEWIYKVLFDADFRGKVEAQVWPTLADQARAREVEYEQRHPKVASSAAN